MSELASRCCQASGEFPNPTPDRVGSPDHPRCLQIMTPRNTLDRLNHLAQAEDRFLQREFLAPVLEASVIQVRIEGIVCKLKLRQPFTGWGLFTAEAMDRARLKRRATLKEQQQYLNLVPARKMILTQQIDATWLAWPAHRGDHRFGPPGLVPVRFPEEVQRFDHLETRFDGHQCFFVRADERSDPMVSDYLRKEFLDEVPLQKLDRPHLTLEDRLAYAVADEFRKKEKRVLAEDRLRDALTHAGAEFRSYLEREDGFRVEFEVAGVRHVSVVNKQDFSLQLAGVCLNGEDGNFDLNSLVGVLRQADGVLRVGEENQGMDAEMYWEAHPRA